MVKQFLTIVDAGPLRAVCKEAQLGVEAHLWVDMFTVLPQHLAVWRRCYPRAVCLTVPPRSVLDASHFALMRGLRSLCIMQCTVATGSVTALAHLQGVKELDIRNCKAVGGGALTVDDGAVAHLRGVRTLKLGWLNLSGVTGAGWSILTGIHTLDIYQSTVSVDAETLFSCLRGVKELDVGCCRGADGNNLSISDTDMVHLAGVQKLHVGKCRLGSDAETLFSHLRGVKELGMSRCKDSTGQYIAITDAALAHLQGIHKLDLRGCDLTLVTATGLSHLVGIRGLYLSQDERYTPHSVHAALAELGLDKVVHWW